MFHIYIRNLKYFLPIIILLSAVSCVPEWEIQNPYETVDWTNFKQYKANFHNHTTLSDGRMSPQRVVEKYHQLGYEILAITDHNVVNYPWTEFAENERASHYDRVAKDRLESGQIECAEELVFENRDPSAMDMIAVPGNEMSSPNHLGSFFNDYSNSDFGNYVTQRKLTGDTFSRQELIDYTDTKLEAIAERNGLVMWFHPTRSRNWEAEKERVAKVTDDPTGWYVDLYHQYDHLISQEVFNGGDNYPEDRQHWDSMLSRIIPERPVWIFSNDDMHELSHLGRNWNVFVLPELSEQWVRLGMENGLFFFVYAPEGHDGPAPPEIESISVDRSYGSIEIQASGYETIQWISSGEVVYEENPINLIELPEELAYVRAKLFHPDGKTLTGTQLFGIKCP